MSLSGALYNAFSGLKANTLAAGLVSTNVANATTEGYGRRTLGLTPGAVGTTGGVRVTGTIRHSDPVLTGDRMMSDAGLANATVGFNFASRIEDLVGESGTPGSLMDRINSFENALLTAASNPASTQRLELVSDTADSLARALNVLSDEVQAARQNADNSIAAQVDTLNSAMARLDTLNDNIIRAGSTGADPTSFYDERQRVLDSIAEIVPLRVVEREKGDIAVFTTGGAVLLDGRPFEVGFEQNHAITPGMTLAAGDLSGLTLNGTPVNAARMFAGGSLAAQFEIRDVSAVERQGQLDGIARDLIERLGPGGPDTTLAATDPGLFTDGGSALIAANETGLAGRIEINTLVAPGSGGAWRLRDGLGAATQGEVGDARLLQGISTALSTSSVPGSGGLTAIARSFADHISEFASTAVGERVRAENDQTFVSIQNTALKELELSKGVDTDQELQRLMQIEQHYTANAKVMSTVDDLLERLMSI
ncbi:flagellar hook-associated protein FlgK [Mameliella sediminis]|uniref:flagellar hook-associated protein FlgK n=1 Tax=Mameliella sediminis TaxID=2836866 RepID=UPI001C46CBD2|nr:flagellar hook-associated protein FlgK [Mameliella sediminis]MBV7395332.1 flagellar hook-associated protein FlgK [Mameliella sediminis]MBY6159472.1 flagellar hook-associated protein FlgK [Mameliella alba]MBY6167943.1 flagellar hook-associated protein FlgK [Mameliella alba]MBY6172964.1 flagellar hook-associated protein FlgK [Mameliella alba]